MNRFHRQLLFLCDSLILALVTALFYVFTQGLSPGLVLIREDLFENLALLYLCTMTFQLLWHTYDSLWRYAESREYLMLLAAALCGFFTYEVLCRALLRAWLPFIFLTGVAGLWVLGELLIRLVYRACRSRRARTCRDPASVPTAILGAGSAGVQLLDELQSNPDSRYAIRCFFDDDPGKLGKNLRGVPVRGRLCDAPGMLRAMDIRQVLVAIPSLEASRRRQLLEALSAADGLRVSVLPGTLELIERRSIHSQLREIRIEDLLGRERVCLESAAADAFLRGKAILVTGGGGSIGAELCRQIARRGPRRLVIVDIYENNAYDIQQELLRRYGGALPLSVEIASVRDELRLRQLLAHYRPEVVFHAAAHKHVPLMEENPQEAVRNNVLGTWNLMRAARDSGVCKFILISTDKAVNPTSVMGASKRLCEMMVQSMAGRSATVFSAVRFGNVLDSNGSVVPLFRQQIAAGGPVTVTDRRVMRYFMTISEAAQLVLEAGAMARQKELYVLDMGHPVRILELAETLIRLSGYEPYRDIPIREIGLRPGEKLYEEPLITGRHIRQTANRQIFVECQPSITPEDLEEKLCLLRRALARNDPGALRQALHAVVPTFREPEAVNAVQPQQPELAVLPRGV